MIEKLGLPWKEFILKYVIDIYFIIIKLSQGIIYSVYNTFVYLIIILMFLNKKYTGTIKQTHNSNCIFLTAKFVLIKFLKFIGVQNQLLISFGTALVCTKILKVRNSNVRE